MFTSHSQSFQHFLPTKSTGHRRYFASQSNLQIYIWHTPLPPLSRLILSLEDLNSSIFFSDYLLRWNNGARARHSINSIFHIQKFRWMSAVSVPRRLQVELKDNEIIVEGKHREQNQGELVHRQFYRRVFSVRHQKESIKCELHAGRLCITGMKTTGDGKRSIPIVVKKAVEQKQQE